MSKVSAKEGVKLDLSLVLLGRFSLAVRGETLDLSLVLLGRFSLAVRGETLDLSLVLGVCESNRGSEGARCLFGLRRHVYERLAGDHRIPARLQRLSPHRHL